MISGNDRGTTLTDALRRLIDILPGRNVFLLFLTPFLVILAVLLAVLSMREIAQSRDSELNVLRETTGAIYEQIAVTRLWNASHGGIYAAVTGDTRPNPYLDVPDRDIVTLAGKRYTKINPAYMTRQLSMISRQRYGNTFRIIGQRPLNPANAPDPWEEGVLRRFADAAHPVSDGTFEEDGVRVFRTVIPLRIEQPCLACHGKQGYRIGDVKGGISIRIPRGKYDAIQDAHTRSSLLSFMLIGGLGFLFTTFVVWLLSRRLASEITRNAEQNRLGTAMELAGAVAHEMRQPMTVVHCRLDLLEDKIERGEQLTREDIEVISSQCKRMNICIDNLQQVTEYRTREYTKGVTILDLNASTASPGSDRTPDRKQGMHGP